jgi:hypothetical protein
MLDISSQPGGTETGGHDHPSDQETAPRVEDRAELIQLEIYKRLDEWSVELINGSRYREPDDPFRDEFAKNPNSTVMHSRWHQWGIIRHTIMTGKYLEEVVPELLDDWFGADAAEAKLGLADEEIDDLSKWDLLRIAAATHDLGKFTQRHLKRWTEEEAKDGLPSFNFKDHEAESGNIVRAWSDRFIDLGLTEDQIEYIAQCSELHFELAKLRDAAKDEPQGFTIDFTSSATFEEMAHTIIQENPHMAREIGIFFIADSLAKTDLHHTVRAKSDEEAEDMLPQIEDEIAARKLPKKLAEVAVQMAANMITSKKYLHIARAA